MNYLEESKKLIDELFLKDNKEDLIDEFYFLQATNEVKELFKKIKYTVDLSIYDFNNKTEQELSSMFNCLNSNKFLGDSLVKHLNYERTDYIYELSMHKPRSFNKSNFYFHYSANPPRTLKFEPKYNDFLIDLKENQMSLIFKFIRYSPLEELFGLYTKLVINYFDKIEEFKNSLFFIDKLDDIDFLRDNYEDLFLYTRLLNDTIYDNEFRYFFNDIDTENDIIRTIDEEKISKLFNCKEEIKNILLERNLFIKEYLNNNAILLKFISKNGDYISFRNQILKDLQD